MVFTRGHKDDDDKAALPQRECRRSNRGNLLEPEDDIIYESDEQMPNKTKQNIKQDKFFTGPCKTRRSSESKVKVEEIVENNAKETQNDDMEVESDIDGEFQQSAIAKDFSLTLDENSDQNEKSDNENGLRRSLRKKNFRNSSQSWLVGQKRLRGYPNIINSSEPENDEPRAAQKSRRHNRTDNNAQRRLKEFHQLTSRDNRYIHSERNHQTNMSRRNTRFNQEFHEDDYDFDDDCKKEIKDDTEDPVSTPQTEKKSKKNRYTRPRRRHTMKVQYEEDSNSYENLYGINYLSRRAGAGRHLRSMREERHVKEDPMSESENSDKDEKTHDEEEEEKDLKDENSEHDSKKTERIIRRREPILMDLKNGPMPCHLPNKRMRKPVTRLTYEAQPNHRKKMSCASSSLSESSDDDNRQQSESRGRSRYSLRQNRKTLSMKDPFQNIPGHHRKHKNSLSYLHSPARKHVFSLKQKATHARDDTSSSSDEKAFEKRKAKSMNKTRNRCLPINMKPEDLQMGGIRDRKVGSSLADVDPMSMDTSITFDSIGGLTQHIKALKEMILFPIMYPEVFQKFAVNPPRGVLFYGPPGTGKTLVARALANECSHDDRKIAFFMRKGADCLSKWVGESERQLRLLFDQAYQMRPSIIFFDEIDGLAPVRSSRQDQIHSSIVSTLLALLDGIDSRGEIVVIGATNRIDAIDPALRRPGRFDREFHFPLPSIEARKQILKINTQKWIPQPSPALLKYLSEETVGYCGADLKSLCGESALVALRNQYPQIYNSKQKLLLNVSSIEVKCRHFMQCIRKIVPAGKRATNASGKKLDYVFEPLMKDSLVETLSMLKNSFPQGFNKLVLNRVLHRPRMLLTGDKNQGQTTLLAPAILHALERIPTHRLDFPSLFSIAARAPEEACAQIFHEAKRNIPSILYVPLIDQLWNSAGDSVKSTFLYLLNDLGSSVPVLFLATVESQYSDLEPEIRQMFSSYREEIFAMSNPSRELRAQFLHAIFYKKVLSKPVSIRRKKRALEELPLAPPPEPRKMKPGEVHRLEYVEEASLRELRIFLRQICAKLAKNKLFYIFTKPVDLDEVTDYLEFISNPMDLETMMSKIDLHQYECAQDFLKDIEQIVANALEYNPDRNPEDKLIRHRACALRDTAYAYIKAEMDTDFEDKCRDIRKNRTKRKHTLATLPPHFMRVAQTTEVQNILASSVIPQISENNKLEEGDESRLTTSNKKRKRRSNWSRGMVSSKKKKIEKDKSDSNIKLPEEDGTADSSSRVDCEIEEEKSESSHSKGTDSDAVLMNGQLSTEDSTNGINKVSSRQDSFYRECITNSFTEDQTLHKEMNDIDNCDTAVSSSEQGPVMNMGKEIIVDMDRLETLYDSCLSATEEVSVEELHHLYSKLAAMCKQHQTSLNRNQLLSEMECEIQRFLQYRTEAG